MSKLQQVFQSEGFRKRYPLIAKYTELMMKPQRPVLGREKEVEAVLDSLSRPEVSNALLLGEAGSGKTMLVMECARQDMSRIYLEVNVSQMAASEKEGEDGSIQMASRMRGLFQEVSDYQAKFGQKQGCEIVLFIDEFHLIVQLSEAAVEALKPILANSGARGVKIIGATTYGEFQDYIASNQALVERLQRISLEEPDRKTVISILKSFAQQYHVYDLISPKIYELIYDYSEQYVPSDSQPRKSILILDGMIGKYNHRKTALDSKLLADVIRERSGVNVNFRVNGQMIKSSLDKRVLSQEYATSVIEKRLQIAVADLNDPTRPMASFLFTGSTGVGKALPDSEVVPVFSKDGSFTHKLNGQLQVGDQVAGVNGKPATVTGVFPRGELPVVKVQLTDGRIVECSWDHLFTVLVNDHQEMTLSIKDLNTLGLKNADGSYKYRMPLGHGVHTTQDREYYVHPYTMGCLLGRGNLTAPLFTVTANDEIAEAIVNTMGFAGYHQRPGTSVYTFINAFKKDGMTASAVKTADVLREYPELLDCYAACKELPEEYFYGSTYQRQALIQGLMDTSATIKRKRKGRFEVVFKARSSHLVEQVREILLSLGVVCSTSEASMPGMTYGENPRELHISITKTMQDWLFGLSYLRDQLMQCIPEEANVFIKSVEDLGVTTPMTCIQVDSLDHLYVSGLDYVVTHNTEMAKSLTALLFGDSKYIVRFDMTDYTLSESAERFRYELADRIWETPFSVLLLDEIEKAHPDVTRVMLQVLDDGRLLNKNGREVSFTNTYVILTTNAAANIYNELGKYGQGTDIGAQGLSADEIAKQRSMMEYEKVIRKQLAADDSFPPELLGRVDVIVPFYPLEMSTLRAIATQKLRQLADNVWRKHRVFVQVLSDVVTYLIEENPDIDTNAGGARNVVRTINMDVTSEIAAYLNTHQNIEALEVSLGNRDKMRTRDKRRRVSEAYIQVKPMALPPEMKKQVQATLQKERAYYGRINRA